MGAQVQRPESIVVTVRFGPGIRELASATRQGGAQTRQARQDQDAQPVLQNQQARQVRLSDGATVSDLLARLGLAGYPPEASRSHDLLVLCNGVRAEAGRKLADGDTVWIFHAMSGG